MSTPKFIVSHNDQQLGPFDESELKAQWAKGAVLGVDYLYDEVKEDWIMVAERFRWAAAGALTETVRVTKKPALTDTVPVVLQPHEATQEIEVEIAPPPVPVKAAPVAATKTAAVPKVIVKPRATATPVVATPAPAVIAPTPAAAAAVAPKGVMVEITDGYGEISIDALDAGSHELAMRGDDMPTSRFRLDVLPTEPVAIEWTVPRASEVGQMVAIQVRVVDARGVPCRHFEETLTLSIDDKRHSVETIDGTGRFEFTRELAGACTVGVACASRPGLEAPAAWMLEWTPGPAVRLVIDGPTELQGGIPLKVRVKALDRFGNVARGYRGTVNLDIKAG